MRIKKNQGLTSIPRPNANAATPTASKNKTREATLRESWDA